MSLTYSRGERIADLCIHLIGVPAGVAGAVGLITHGFATGGAATIASLVLYGAGLVGMLALSAAYNLTDSPGPKELLRRFDHAAIFTMIAGTYTPFMLLKIGGGWGIGLLAFVWLTAFAGAGVKLLYPRRLERVSIALYLALGWSAVVALRPIVEALSPPTLLLLAAGGVLYTLGVVFHVSERLAYQNALWHACVLLAAACHYAAVWEAVAPVPVG
jgi:hemolysin III